MKKKYLFLTLTEAFAGAEHVQVDYFRFIDHSKFSVILGLKKDVFSPYLKSENLPIELVSLPDLTKSDRFITKFRKYYIFFNSLKPHCVVFNQYWLRSFTLAEILAAFIVTRGSSYMFVHDCPPVFPKDQSGLRFGFFPDFGLHWRICRLFQTLLGFFTKATIAVSKAAQEALVKGHKFPTSKVKMVYHGVDTEKYKPSAVNREALRRSFNTGFSDVVIISTAMLWPGKRIDRLVEAFAEILRGRPDLRLLIAGTGSEYGTLMNMVQSLGDGIANRIEFLGFRDDILELLQLSDIYVLPSDSEGLPIACLEAMACGLISVVTDCGGTSEIIRNGYNGFLVEKSREGVMAGLKNALNLTPDEKQEMSRNSRRFVEEEFNLNKNIRTGLGVLKLSAE